MEWHTFFRSSSLDFGGIRKLPFFVVCTLRSHPDVI
jgi:hypothetical protein